MCKRGIFAYMVCHLLTLNAQVTTKIVCFSRQLKCLRSLCGKQCGPRSDCSYRSSLFWVHAVGFYTYFASKVRQLFAADNFSRQHFQMHFFLGALRVKSRVLCECVVFVCIHECECVCMSACVWRERTEYLLLCCSSLHPL